MNGQPDPTAALGHIGACPDHVAHVRIMWRMSGSCPLNPRKRIIVQRDRHVRFAPINYSLTTSQLVIQALP
jgi:hypothetical protein